MRRHQMRTTLQRDDDVLAAARVLARQGLVGPPHGAASAGPSHRNGLPLLPWNPQGAPMDLELVNSLRDELA
jgi:hypothetical protein